jgi:outer membrane beta-barrel protein
LELPIGRALAVKKAAAGRKNQSSDSCLKSRELDPAQASVPAASPAQESFPMHELSDFPKQNSTSQAQGRPDSQGESQGDRALPESQGEKAQAVVAARGASQVPRERGFASALLLVLASALWLALVAASWAGASEPAPEVSGRGYDFRWLDPDKKVYVLQNRRYQKAGKLLVSALAGVGTSNPYRSTTLVDPRLAFYFSESWGIEFFHAFLGNSPNGNFRALEDASPNVFPAIREISRQYGGLLHWAPWYAKINVFDRILYFDWQFSAGAGNLQTRLLTQEISQGPLVAKSQSLFGLFLGTGHQYHLSERFIARLDFTASFHQAPAFGNSGSETWFSNYTFGLGLGLRI